MKHAIIPSKIRAFAHRCIVLSALRANSSLSSRLTRYNAFMVIARALDADGGAV
ncbi:MAG: putative rane protein [Pseudomonas sp.]|nr:putative rane protein [Pseudomonas sp.]